MSVRGFCKPSDPQSVWSAHLQKLLRGLGIPLGTVEKNLSESLALYCRTYHPHGVRTSDMALLVARCFCAVGNQASAEKVLRSMKPHKQYPQRWLEILSELHQFPELLPFFSAGVIRPADWAGAELDRMWTLDFALLQPSEKEQHEMMLYRMVRAMIDKMLPFWDATAGEGVLGLKNLSALHLVATSKKGEKSLTSSARLLEYVADVLKQAAAQRNWNATPAVLNLDLK